MLKHIYKTPSTIERLLRTALTIRAEEQSPNDEGWVCLVMNPDENTERSSNLSVT